MSELSDETRTKIKRALKTVPGIRKKAPPLPTEDTEEEEDREKADAKPRGNPYETRYKKLLELIGQAKSISQLKRLKMKLEEMEASEKQTKH